MNLLKKKEIVQKETIHKICSQPKWEVKAPPPADDLKPYSPEWFLKNYLENWNDEDLELAINNDVRPDLSQAADLILDQTTDFFVNFLRTERPDLKHAQTKEGREWIRRIVKSATGFGNGE